MARLETAVHASAAHPRALPASPGPTPSSPYPAKPKFARPASSPFRAHLGRLAESRPSQHLGEGKASREAVERPCGDRSGDAHGAGLTWEAPTAWPAMFLRFLLSPFYLAFSRAFAPVVRRRTGNPPP